MSQSALPQAQNWNHYWGLDKTKAFTEISWSKRRIISTMKELIKPGNTLLDAGCGSGFFSKFFSDQGMNVTALDYSEGALKITREKTQGKVKVVQEDLVKAHLETRLADRFDVIFTDGLLEHFSEEHKDCIFQNLLSVLKKDGVIVTFVPNKFSPWELIRPFYMPGIEEKPFTLNQLIQLNERNHLQVIKKGGVNTLPFRFSPDVMAGSVFGMLLFTFSRRINS